MGVERCKINDQFYVLLDVVGASTTEGGEGDTKMLGGLTGALETWPMDTPGEPTMKLIVRW